MTNDPGVMNVVYVFKSFTRVFVTDADVFLCAHSCVLMYIDSSCWARHQGQTRDGYECGK